MCAPSRRAVALAAVAGGASASTEDYDNDDVSLMECRSMFPELKLLSGSSTTPPPPCGPFSWLLEGLRGVSEEPPSPQTVCVLQLCIPNMHKAVRFWRFSFPKVRRHQESAGLPRCQLVGNIINPTAVLYPSPILAIVFSGISNTSTVAHDTSAVRSEDPPKPKNYFLLEWISREL